MADVIRYLLNGVIAFALTCGAAYAHELSDIRTLRSLSAEAAEVIRLEQQHRITEIYARAMKQKAREEIADAGKNAGAPVLKQVAEQAIAAIGRNDAATLRKLAQELLNMEGPHGRAD